MADEIVEKTCTKCKEAKPLTSFHKMARSKDGRKPRCRKCINEQYAHLSTESYTRWTSLWAKYGITPDEFDAITERQGGVCAICKRPPKKKRLCVDHCHKTGRIRGLLCDSCNHGLGHFEDSVEWLMTAIQYLQSVTGDERPVRGPLAHIVPPYKRHRRGKDHHFNKGKALVGEKHGMALFNEEQIRECRKRYDAGEITSTDLAKEHGVPKATMQAITSRRNWKHIE